MAKIKKSLQKQNLDQVPIFIEDVDPSSRYFQLREVDDVLHSGRQGFLIAGSLGLVNSTEVLIEILDSNGDPIFVSPVRNFAEGRARFVSVEVYEDTPTGLATMTILGEAAVDLDGNLVPEEWRGAFNVKFQKSFQVDPLRTNDSKIRVFQVPELAVSEILAPFRKTVTSSLSLVNGTGSAAGATALQNVGTGVPNIYTVIAPSTPISKSMEGGSFTASIVEPNFTGTFTASISSVLNDKSFQVDPGLINDAGTKFIPFTGVTDFTISFQDTSVFSTTTLTRSFADVALTKLKTFSGDIARAKMFVRSEESTTDFEFLTDIRLESQELTATQSINLGPATRMGSFFAQEVVDEFWVGGTITQSSIPPYIPDATAVTVARDTAQLIDAITITNLSDLGATGSTTPQAFIGFTGSAANDVTLEFINTLEYTFGADVLCTKDNDAFEARMDVYLTGSAFPSTSSLGQRIATFTCPAGEIQRLTRDFESNFSPSRDGTAKLQFVIFSGDWFISDTFIRSAVETGFNPDCAEFIIPIFNKRFEQLQFKAILFDPNNNEFPAEILSDFVFFDGGNLLLRGADHRIEGTLTISPSGSGVTITSEGFLDVDGNPQSGSAIFSGEGRVFSSGTGFFLGEDADGNPQISLGDKLHGYVSESGEFILNISGNLQISSGTITAPMMDVDELSAITANMGTLTAGVIRNIGDTRGIVFTDDGSSVTGSWDSYINFVPPVGQPFLKHSSSLLLEDDGTAIFGGVVSSSLFTANQILVEGRITASMFHAVGDGNTTFRAGNYKGSPEMQFRPATGSNAVLSFTTLGITHPNAEIRYTNSNNPSIHGFRFGLGATHEITELGIFVSDRSGLPPQVGLRTGSLTVAGGFIAQSSGSEFQDVHVSGSLLVEGVDGFDSSPDSASVYVGDTQNFVRATYDDLMEIEGYWGVGINYRGGVVAKFQDGAITFYGSGDFQGNAVSMGALTASLNAAIGDKLFMNYPTPKEVLRYSGATVYLGDVDGLPSAKDVEIRRGGVDKIIITATDVTLKNNLVVTGSGVFTSAVSMGALTCTTIAASGGYGLFGAGSGAAGVSLRDAAFGANQHSTLNLQSLGVQNTWLGIDQYYDGAWKSVTTSAWQIYKSGHNLIFYGDESLTPNVGYTPTARVTFQPDGKVGIGTIPDNLFHLKSETDALIKFEDTTDGAAGYLGVAAHLQTSGPIDYLGVRGESGVSFSVGTAIKAVINSSGLAVNAVIFGSSSDYRVVLPVGADKWAT